MAIQNTGLLSGGEGVDIGSLTEVTPVTGDFLLIEDASDGNIQKKVNANNFLNGTGSIADNAVTNPKLADMESGRFKARITVGTGDPEDLTASQVRSLLNVEDGADVTDTANVTSAGALMDSELTDLAGIKALDTSTLQVKPSEGAFVDGDKTKLDYLTVTQAVDLDSIETRVNDLDASVILQGTWDASSGSFPGSGSAQAGHSYIVSVGGTVDSVEFTANDRIVAITDNASTSTYASNWHKLDYTDAVLSVAGKTGAVTLQEADITDLKTYLNADGSVALTGNLDVGDNNIHSVADLSTDTITADSTSGGLQIRNNNGTAIITAGAGGATNTNVTINGATSFGGNNLTNVGTINSKSLPTGGIVGDSDTQTLTNKTIDADSNTISNLAVGSEVSTNFANSIISNVNQIKTTNGIKINGSDSNDLGSGVYLSIEDQNPDPNQTFSIRDGLKLRFYRNPNAYTLEVPSSVTNDHKFVLPGVNGSNGQVLTTDGLGNTSWTTVSGSGDVTSTSNITDNRLTKGDGGSKGIQETGITVDDSNNVTGLGTINTKTISKLIENDETDASGYSFVVDEDDFSSDSATKVPTQQSVKAYVDVSQNLGTNTAVNTNSIDDGTSLGQHVFSAYENQDLNVNSNTDTSHYDFTGLADGDWTLITFINDTASTDYDLTFNTGEVAPNSSFTIYAGDRVLCKVIKKGTEIRYNFDVPNIEVA